MRKWVTLFFLVEVAVVLTSFFTTDAKQCTSPLPLYTKPTQSY